MTKALPRRADCQYSKSAVKKAGKVLRTEPQTDAEVDAWLDSLLVMEEWRACHSYALNAAQMGLRSRVGTVGATGAVSQRLKRAWSIIQKLEREPTMQLSTIQDIAGCRAVVSNRDEVYRVVDQFHRTAKNIVRVYDYIDTPRETGYRGIHVVVRYDDLPVEVQIRSELQHVWAIAVEDLSGRNEYDLKNNQGPDDLQRMFVELGDILAEVEDGGSPTPASVGQIVDAIARLKQGTLDLG